MSFDPLRSPIKTSSHASMAPPSSSPIRPSVARQLQFSPKTPISSRVHTATTPLLKPNASPLVTPVKRYPIALSSLPEGPVQATATGCLTPKISKVLSTTPACVYSLEATGIAKSPGGTSYKKKIRYIGATARGKKRLYEHSTSIKRQSSPFSIEVQKMAKKGPVSLSFGPLSILSSPSKLDVSEKKAIRKCRERYGLSVLNKREGGGGGTIVQEQATLSDLDVRKLLFRPMGTMKKLPLRSDKGKIGSPFSLKAMSVRNVLYVFERTFPHQLGKCYVGIARTPFSKRIGSHLHYANNPGKSKLKDSSFYQELHQYPREFRLGFISCQSMIDKGATLAQIEKIATLFFSSRKNSDGTGGYNLTKGGGGGAVKHA